MAATLQSISLLGTSSHLLAPSCSSGSSSEKQGRSVHLPRQQSRRSRFRVVRAAETDAPGAEPAAAEPEEPPSVDFAFVSPRLLPDGTPDVHYRTACGGQKLRDIMLEGYIDLYGPYDKLLLNCSGGGECGTCIVEVVEGNEMLSPKNEVEKEKLKRKPKNWRLACQATVGNPDSTGQMALEGVKERIEGASADARHQLARKNSRAIVFGRAKVAAQKAGWPASLSSAKEAGDLAAPPPPP